MDLAYRKQLAAYSFKLAFVGGSGTGKTTIARLTRHSLNCSIFEAGELMRDRAKSRGQQVDINPQALMIEGDRFVDGQMLKLLEDPEWSGIFHGRTIRLLAEGLIKANKLKKFKFLMAAVDCRPDVRANRGLDKYREKYDAQATHQDVLNYHITRDRADNERYLLEFGESHGLRRPGYLTDTHNEFTRGISIPSDFLTPKQELFYVLTVLHNKGHIGGGGFAIALLRGLTYKPSN